MKKTRLFFGLLLAAGVIVYFARHAVLERLRTERLGFEAQAAEAARLEAALGAARAQASAEPSGLAPAEKSELLRLRGEMGGLRRDLAQASNRLAAASAPLPARAATAPGTGSEVSQEEVVAKMQTGKQGMLTLMIYARAHDDRFPGTFAEAETPGAPPSGVSDLYEMVATNLNLSTLKAPDNIIVLREKQSWRGAGGRWQRAYAFADGHVEVASSDTPDFTTWEENRRRAAAGEQ